MNKVEFDSNLGKLGSNSARQIFTEFKLGSSLFKNLINKPEHFKVRHDSPRLQPYCYIRKCYHIFWGKLPKQHLRFLEITNCPLTCGKLQITPNRDVIVGKFDKICLTSSYPNYSGLNSPFVARERL